MMHFKKTLLFSFLLIFFLGTLPVKGFAPGNAVALEPWTVEVIDQLKAGDVGKHVTISHFEDKAYVSYYDATNGNLKLAYEVDPGTGNCPGSPDWRCETVDNSSNDVGQYSSIDTRQGYIEPSHIPFVEIGISYYDSTAKALKFATNRCLSENECAWVITTVDDDSSTSLLIPEDDIGKYTSFTYEPFNFPNIFYHVSRQQPLANPPVHIGMVKRAYASGSITGNCEDNWHCQLVSQSAASADYGIHISSDNGMVAYYDEYNQDLYLAEYNGTVAGWRTTLIDSEGDVGSFVSFQCDIFEQHQILAYYDATNETIKSALKMEGGATSSGCTNPDFMCFAVHLVGSPGKESMGLSLTFDAQNRPVIAYQNYLSTFKLLIARPSDAYQNPEGNCGEKPPGFFSLYWECRVIDRGTDLHYEANYAAISVNPEGLATIAYYEADKETQEGRLKIAKQNFALYLPLTRK